MKSRRRQQTHDQVTQEIVAAARALMREEGAAALSMQALARRMDMRAPSLYNYFAGKMDLYDALFCQGYRLFDAYVQEKVAGAATWQEELHRYLAAYMAFARENPELYQLCFERPVPGFVPSQESLELSFSTLRRGYATAARWRQAVQTDLSDKQMADLVLAVMHGLTALHLANEPDLPVGQGRFGGLISAAVALFDNAWSQPPNLKEANDE
jgi:AcrR family transcriptional regulator